jgi:hypothetical protein
MEPTSPREFSIEIPLALKSELKAAEKHEKKVLALFDDHVLVRNIMRIGVENKHLRQSSSSVYPNEAKLFQDISTKISQVWSDLDLKQQSIKNMLSGINSVQTIASKPMGLFVVFVTMVIGLYILIEEWKNQSDTQNATNIKILFVLLVGFVGGFYECIRSPASRKLEAKCVGLLKQTHEIIEKKSVGMFLNFLTELFENVLRTKDIEKFKEKFNLILQLLEKDFPGKTLLSSDFSRGLDELNVLVNEQENDPQKAEEVMGFIMTKMLPVLEFELTQIHLLPASPPSSEENPKEGDVQSQDLQDGADIQHVEIPQN